MEEREEQSLKVGVHSHHEEPSCSGIIKHQVYINFLFIFWYSCKLIFYFYDQVSETEIEEMFDVADTDGDGIIGYPEFMVSRVLD